MRELLLQNNLTSAFVLFFSMFVHVIKTSFTPYKMNFVQLFMV